MSGHTFRAGDVVLHRPSGEEWLIAATRDGHVFPSGWPPYRAPAADCELVDAASDALHRVILIQHASSADPYGLRRDAARANLAAVEAEDGGDS